MLKYKQLVTTFKRGFMQDQAHNLRIMNQLKKLGMKKYGMLRYASRYLPNLIHKDETLHGIVQGWSTMGSALLVATDRRVIFLDKKPFFTNFDEISFEVVSGVSYSKAGLLSTVTLHTRIKDYAVRTTNQECALKFIDYIETHCLDRRET